MSYLIKDSTSEKKCAAKTAFIVTLSVFLLKILISGMSIGDLQFETANYTGMASFLAPLGAVYFGRSYVKAQKNV
jgi:hypothetical protein